MSASRIAPLDAIRGLAAFGVALYHYTLLTPDGARPFSQALGWLYGYGQWAVPLFYVLSGYIFFEAYAEPLGQSRLDGREFFWLRASRLYPLHVVTLFVVAGLQALAFRSGVPFFNYAYNDGLHFLLNLGFVQFAWLLPNISYNVPAWSLTIEAGLYVTFFYFARRFGAAARPRLVFGAICLALSSLRMALPPAGLINVFFAEGLGCFFLGGCLQLTQAWPRRPRLWLGLGLLAAGWALFHLADGRRETAPVLFAGAVMLSLAVEPLRRAAEGRLFGWLGEISYSVYLWQFPVAIALALVSAKLVALDFSAPATLALYLTLTLAISTLSFHRFEAPARAFVRRWAFARPLATARA